jgi:hypothetical protein
MNNQSVGAAQTAAQTIANRRPKGVRIISWICAPIVGALILMTLPRSPSSLSAKSTANGSQNSNQQISLQAAKFIEIPGTPGTRAWSNGITVIYARDGKLVDAFVVGKNLRAWVPQAGTRLYNTNGQFSGLSIPKIADTTELQQSNDSPAANVNASSLSLQ